MRYLRSLAATIAMATFVTAQLPAAAAGSYAKTNFTLVTPQTTIIYATIQSTSAGQAKLVAQFGGALGAAAAPSLQLLLGQVLGAGTVNGTSISQAGIQQLIGPLGGALGRVFNGELGLAMLPITLSPGSGSVLPTPHLHLLLEAGLQPGISEGTLLFATQALNLPLKTASSYKGVTLVSIDLNALAGAVSGGAQSSGGTQAPLIPAGAPLPSVFYAAVLGNDLVLASDIPSLEAAIDTFQHSQPSIAASEAFSDAVGLLPADHFATVYFHFGTGNAFQVLQSLGASVSLLPPAVHDPRSGIALSLTAEPGALMLTTSTPPATHSTVLSLPAA